MIESLGVPATFAGGFKLFWSLTLSAPEVSVGFIVGWVAGVCLFSFILSAIRITGVHLWRAVRG